MSEEMSKYSREKILVSFPLMHQVLHAVFTGEHEHFTKTQFNILIILHSFGEHTMMQLSELIGISKEQATRAVAPLVDAGLVERYTLPSNRNHVYVRLSEEGQIHIRELTEFCSKYIDNIIKQQLSPDEIQELDQHLSALIPLLIKIMDK